MIVRRAGSSSTLRKTFLARHIDYAKRVLEKYTHNGPSDAFKNLNQEENHRRRTRIEVITMATSWQHNHHRHPPLHDAGGALLSSDPTQPSATHSTSPHMPTREEGKAMTMSWQRNHLCHPQLHDPGDHPQLYDPEGDPGDEPGDPLLRRDPTPTTVKPQRRRLRFLRACRHDTPGEARSWRRHLSARGRYMLLL